MGQHDSPRAATWWRRSRLKQELDGEIVVPPATSLGRTLIEHDLVDALRVVVFPVVLGAGDALLRRDQPRKPLRLVAQQRIGEGLVLLTYEFLVVDRGEQSAVTRG